MTMELIHIRRPDRSVGAGHDRQGRHARRAVTPAILYSAVAVLLQTWAGAAHGASFGHFPSGPTGTCSDTMSILTLKTWLNTTTGPCNAATSSTSGTPTDTVLGVGGIVIGFDDKATTFDVFLQMGVGGARTGIDVYTGAVDLHGPLGLNRGDSVVVEYACVGDLQGAIELVSPDGLIGSPNIVLRRVSGNHPLPPFFHGSTSDFAESPANPLFAQHVSELVALDGPVRVARTAGLPTNGLLVVSDAATADSVFIDYNKLTTLLPPAVGTVLGSISGISNSTSRGFRIMPRDSNDILPPGITAVESRQGGLSLAIFPNPSRSATVTFTLAHPATVSLGVFDLLGRRVAQLVDGLLADGDHRVAWNGLDDAGARTRAGVYFYRLQAGDEIRTVRAILIPD